MTAFPMKRTETGRLPDWSDTLTKLQIAREVRARLDVSNPGWRDSVREMMNAEKPGWVAHDIRVQGPDGKFVRVALLANPERVPDPSEIDPATDPFAGL